MKGVRKEMDSVGYTVTWRSRNGQIGTAECPTPTAAEEVFEAVLLLGLREVSLWSSTRRLLKQGTPPATSDGEMHA